MLFGRARLKVGRTHSVRIWTLGSNTYTHTHPAVLGIIAAEFVNGPKLTERRWMFIFCSRAHYPTPCPAIVETASRALWANAGLSGMLFLIGGHCFLRRKIIPRSCPAHLAPCFLFLSGSVFPPSPLSLSPTSLSLHFFLPAAQWGTTVCCERSYPVDLAPGVLIYFISHWFSILCHFFLSPTPSFSVPSFFFFSTRKSFSSLIPWKHTNRTAISQERKHGERARMQGTRLQISHHHVFWRREFTISFFFKVPYMLNKWDEKSSFCSHQHSVS